MSLGFNNTQTQIKAPIVEPTFTNAICYGQTGSGKTTGFMLPNIENRIKLNHGMLIYDFKGNLHEQVKYIANKYDKLDRVFEIGKQWGKNIDILKYATPKAIEKMFSSISGHHSDTYWEHSSATLFENLFYLLKDMKRLVDIIYSINKQAIMFDYKKSRQEYYPNLKNILNIVQSPKHITKFFYEIKIKLSPLYEIIDSIIIEYYNKSYKKRLAKILKLKNSIEKRFFNLSEYHKMDTEGSSTSGKNAILQVLSQTLLAIANKKCFNKDEFDIVNGLLDGNIIIINVEDFTTKMLNMLNLSITTKLIQQTSVAVKKQPITIFIDEAQKVLSSESLPDVDVCRENNFEFILSTQDVLLLEKQLGTLEIALLLPNITSKYSFKTMEPQITNINTTKLKEFEYVDISKNTKHKAKPIFINEKELFEVEYKYQKSNDTFKKVFYSSKKSFILRHSTSLAIDDKVYLYFYDTKVSKIVDYDIDIDSLDEYYKQIINTNNSNKSNNIQEEYDEAVF